MKLKFKTIEELENSIKLEDVRQYKTRMIVKSMNELYQMGKKHFYNDAKEEAYSHFFRYMSLLQTVLKSSDYKKNPDQFKSNLTDASFVCDKLEQLKADLIKFYKLAAPVEVEQKPEVKVSVKVEPALSLGDAFEMLAVSSNNFFWIGIDRLIESIKSKNKPNYVIFDTRSSEEYDASHLYLHEVNNVNIPVPLFPKGTSAKKLETLLTGEAQEKWKNRSKYDVLILMGDSDTPDRITEPVQCLYDIITKWDPNTKYKHKPYILEHGYQDFSFMYPTYCTAAVYRFQKPSTLESDLLLDSIEYPILELEDVLDTQDISKITIPDFDRTKKPVYATPEVTNNPANLNISKSAKKKAEEGSLVKPDIKRRNTSEEITDPTATETTQMEIDPPTPKKEEEDSKPVKPTTTTAATIAEKPSIDRSSKPVKLAKERIFNPSRYRAIPRMREEPSPGLTGLQNPGNYCYLNSIVQVLFNLRGLRDYFINNHYLKHLKRDSVSKGQVTDELVAMCKLYWSGEYSSFNTVRLRNTIGELNSRFSRDTQEDCHEAFMFILNYLHEDLSYKVAIQDVSSIPERRFIEYMKESESIINSFFYGQNETRVRCGHCTVVNFTYTPFSCISLELIDTNLKKCIEASYQEEQIDDYRCEKCNVVGQVTKVARIYRASVYLPIHLKRFRNCKINNSNKSQAEISFNKNCDAIEFTDTMQLTVQNQTADYQLIGVTMHSGDMEHGHYRACVYRSYEHRWILFDDERIKAYDNIFQVPKISEQVYMLFYKLVAK